MRRKIAVRKSIRTDFPQASAKLFVFVEHARELIAVVENAHQTQQVLRRNCSVDFLAAQEIVRRLD